MQASAGRSEPLLRRQHPQDEETLRSQLYQRLRGSIKHCPADRYDVAGAVCNVAAIRADAADSFIPGGGSVYNWAAVTRGDRV